MEETEGDLPPGETNLQLHKLFVDLALENDLKPEDMEWFRSRISLEKPEKKKKKKEGKAGSERKKTVILTEEDRGKRTERPNKFYLQLSETNTIWLLSLEPSLSENTVDDGERVRRENETYSMKKTKKELIRKRCMADSQTPRLIEKSKGTLTSEVRTAHKYVFASEWDLRDSYDAAEKCAGGTARKFLVCAGTNRSLQEPPPKVGFDPSALDESRVSEVFSNSDFEYAALAMERLLASNCFQRKQSVFKEKAVTRYYDGPTSFSYMTELLWSFQKDLERPLAVTDMDWNPLNEDLLAIGYGDVDFERSSSGLICVWSPKNPRQPERRFEFDDSVTALHYSRRRPNILAVGTRRGNVYVVDVSGRVGNVRNLGSEGWDPRPGPVWRVEWFPRTELGGETEELLAIGESGALMLFSVSKDKETRDVVRLDYVVSGKKVFEKDFLKKMSRRAPIRDEIFDRKTFSGLSFSLFADGNFCYISTKEGVVVKCNLRNPSMTDGIFLGHDGPVYAVRHSPVTDVVYFTCGADWTVKIWMEGIPEPVITLQHKAPVACARWSPTIPTVIASVGEELSLWDIARNVLTPMSSRVFEDSKKPFSTLAFSRNGMNVVVGGRDGLVHVVHLSELPRIPFLQKEALIGAIKAALLKSRQHLLPSFSRVVETNREKLKTEIRV